MMGVSALLFLLTGLALLVLRNEYPDWGARLARAAIFAAARCHTDRERMRDEWLAELAAIQGKDNESTGLLFGGSLLFRYGMGLPLKLVDPLYSYWAIFGFVLFPTVLGFGVIALVIIGFAWFERRELGKLESGVTLSATLASPARTTRGKLVTLALTIIVSGVFFLWAHSFNSSVFGFGVAGAFSLGYAGVLHSPSFRTRVEVWRRARLDLLDPR